MIQDSNLLNRCSLHIPRGLSKNLFFLSLSSFSPPFSSRVRGLAEVSEPSLTEHSGVGINQSSLEFVRSPKGSRELNTGYRNVG